MWPSLKFLWMLLECSKPFTRISIPLSGAHARTFYFILAGATTTKRTVYIIACARYFELAADVFCDNCALVQKNARVRNVATTNEHRQMMLKARQENSSK